MNKKWIIRFSRVVPASSLQIQEAIWWILERAPSNMDPIELWLKRKASIGDVLEELTNSPEFAQHMRIRDEFVCDELEMLSTIIRGQGVSEDELVAIKKHEISVTKFFAENKEKMSVSSDEIDQIYTILLDRVPNKQEKEIQSLLLKTTWEVLFDVWNANHCSHKKIVMLDEETIRKAYLLFCGRNPSGAELLSYTSRSISQRSFLAELWCSVDRIGESIVHSENDVYQFFWRVFNAVTDREYLCTLLDRGITYPELFKNLSKHEILYGQVNALQAVSRDAIERVYQCFLGRTPTEEEVNSYFPNPPSLALLLTHVWLSEEMGKREQEGTCDVRGVKQRFLQIFNAISNEQHISTLIEEGVTSSELFKNLSKHEILCGQVNALQAVSRDAIERVYQCLLGRTPTEEELNSYFPNPPSLALLLTHVWLSEEMGKRVQEKICDIDTVEQLALKLLGYIPTPTFVTDIYKKSLLLAK